MWVLCEPVRQLKEALAPRRPPVAAQSVTHPGKQPINMM